MSTPSLVPLLLIVVAGLALAAEQVPAAQPAEAHFATGTAAAAEGDYQSALRAFRAALAAGQEGPAVHYNIGVSAWWVGELEVAEEAFLAAAAYPAMAPLAHYNLGLVAQRRGDEAAARRWFTLARDGSASDPALNQLATSALAGLPPPAAPDPPVAVYLAANAGYDDNVALLADGDLVGVSDLDSSYAELQLAALGMLGRDFSVQTGAYLLNYTDLPELDQAGAQLGLWYQPMIGAWRLEVGAGYALNQLDGERFEDQRRLGAGLTRRFGNDWRLRWRIEYDDIEGQEPYAGLTGDRLAARLQVRRYLDRAQWQLEYRFETNDRDDPAFSPDRNRLDAEWRQDLPRGLRLEAGLGWRHSSYDTPGLSWTERRATAVLGLSGPLAGAWEWVLRYDYTRNDASLEEFDYSRNRGFAGVQASF